MRDPEKLLPPEMLSAARVSGREYGWSFDRVNEVLDAAKDRSLACIGGQPQFLLPGGTCELYWQNCDSADRAGNESWSDYVSRSHREVRTCFARLSVDEVVSDGIARFPFLKAQAADGTSLSESLVFILYFQAEPAAT